MLCAVIVHKYISLKLRMRRFDACVKPGAIFAMHVLPLRVADTSRVAATERRMKRSIVGWARHADDDWPTTAFIPRNRGSKVSGHTSGIFVFI